MSESFKNAKDSLVASLFELSKSAQDAANATVNFYKLASEEGDAETLKSLSETWKSVAFATDPTNSNGNGSKVNGSKVDDDLIATAAAAAAAVSSVEIPTVPSVGKAKVTKAEKPRKKKVEKDPNAPKKPLTIYFAFSFHTRKSIKDDRERKGLPALSAIDMNEIVKQKWESITPEEKEIWQKKYANELNEYQKEKEKYRLSKEDKPNQVAAVAAEVARAFEPTVDIPLLSSVDAPKKKEKKRKSEKSDKKIEKKSKKDKIVQPIQLQH
ncbi:hypothetical protein G9P44_000771 [Scheffersomyces stipitis]|nr:hypothetical protein G9P44_000771 [Scheffersomyces stipitis]